jgi:hypothetical protein
MWATNVLLDLGRGSGARSPLTFNSLITQGDPNSLLPSLALTGYNFGISGCVIQALEWP